MKHIFGMLLKTISSTVLYMFNCRHIIWISQMNNFDQLPNPCMLIWNFTGNKLQSPDHLIENLLVLENVLSPRKSKILSRPFVFYHIYLSFLHNFVPLRQTEIMSTKENIRSSSITSPLVRLDQAFQ